MYIIPFSKFSTMNDYDLKTLKMFAEISLGYLGEDELYNATQLWQHLENGVQLKRRMKKLIPLIETIIHPDTTPKDLL